MENNRLPVVLILIQIVNYISAIGSLLAAGIFAFIPVEYLSMEGQVVINQYIAAGISLVLSALTFWAIVLIHLRKKAARFVFIGVVIATVALGEVIGYFAGISMSDQRIYYVFDLAMLIYVAMNKRVKQVLNQ